MNEETKVKIKEEMERLKANSKKPFSERYFAYCSGKLAGIQYVLGLIEESADAKED